ncbi:hypothetical protein U8527_07735 [Kordia algicida OT-1]|uniref:Uncharacterized protein n=1 Tax=Kordia algicida OT-1 TaxID=391587 RepID=A9E8R0_9FLAO|nr:hypothetical protein [Kordia algicida]EDP94794.1 hypothetical protein KAOT1_01170 [Kordia algicida OT-1]
MKKRNLTSLVLNKKAISKVNYENVNGGVPGKPPSALPDPKTVHRKLCYLQDNTALHCPSS